MCGLPGERDGRSRRHRRDGRDDRPDRPGGHAGDSPKVTASVSNFVPKAHTPYQWNGMQTREYFHWAHQYMRRRLKIRSVQLKCHQVETSMLEGLLSRGDRRLAEVIELAWRRGARLDSWAERLDADLWWKALADVGQGRAGMDFALARASRLGPRRSPALGPYQREKGPDISREGAAPCRGTARGDGGSRVKSKYEVPSTKYERRAELHPACRSTSVARPFVLRTLYFVLMSSYRLLALDIDGTLINSREELTPATREAIRRARRAGIQVVLGDRPAL